MLAYYRIILEDAEADPSAANTDMHRAALSLAECEAASDRALDAETQAMGNMAIYLKTSGERNVLKLVEASKTLDLENPAVLEMMMMRTAPDEGAEELEPEGEVPENSMRSEGAPGRAEEAEFMSGGLRILYNINRHNLARRRRQLERIAVYRRRAEGRRRRAFKTWLRVKFENDSSKLNAILS